ncbi:unnamed protein product [marine sediment metagenome]|uniref:U3 small nucleolar RNA-associated protein 13 C-terminal domain-containing protein n=1 Tax=marine sediment metagenome TaxID=412755 RepID=X1VCU3_9ZZZZ
MRLTLKPFPFPTAEPAALGPLVRGFSAERLVTFLRYIRDWNTKLRFRSVAQQLLAVVLRSYPPTVICDLPDIKTVRLLDIISHPVDRATLTGMRRAVCGFVCRCWRR